MARERVGAITRKAIISLKILLARDATFGLQMR
jgi:hypothetical protein